MKDKIFNCEDLSNHLRIVADAMDNDLAKMGRFGIFFKRLHNTILFLQRTEKQFKKEIKIK